MATPVFSIVIPTYNHLESDLKPCLNSIRKMTNLSNCEIIVSANGCTDGTEEYVRSLGEPFRLVSCQQPLGYAAATNAGMALARGEFVVLLNNDTEVLDGTWLSQLAAPHLADENVAATGPSKRFIGPYPFVIFYCVMFRRSLLYRVGFLDEAFAPGSGEDCDFCVRAVKQGMRIVRVPKDDVEGAFPIWHKDGKTVNENPDRKAIFARNTDILTKRYLAPLPPVAGAFEGEWAKPQRSVARFPGAPVETLQLEWEFGRLLQMYREAKPRKVIEIGSYAGGTLFHWMSNTAPRAKFVCMDIMPTNAPLWRQWAAEKRMDLTVISTPSQRGDTVLEVVRAIGRDVDFLFIDGDHSYEGVKADFLSYFPLVRPGGMAVLHDIVPHPNPAVGVHRFWNEIREAGYRIRELYSDWNQGQCGIGVVFK